MAILITGAHGMLGSTFAQDKVLEKIGHEVIYTDHKQCDITDESMLEQVFSTYTISYIINCAAYTNVEQAQGEGELSNYHVNTIGPMILSAVASRHGIPIIHISTDYVFDGTQTTGYIEQDTPKPLNQYGIAKWLGEQACLHANPTNKIIRTSRLYGGGTNHKNFVNTMMTLGQTKPELSIINDQRGAPTYTSDLAEAIVQLISHIDHYPQSIFHWSNTTQDGGITWYQFAQEIFSYTQNPIPLSPIPSDQYPTKAQRPQHSWMINQSTIQLPDRKKSLHTYLDTIQSKE